VGHAGSNGGDLGYLLQALSGPPTALGAVAFITLVLDHPWARIPRAVAERLGRVSLTAYLAESILASLLFMPYGLGLFGELGPATGMLLAPPLWLAIAGIATLWLRQFRLGPFEWALRTLTYWGSQPLRQERTEAPQPAVAATAADPKAGLTVTCPRSLYHASSCTPRDE